MKITIILIIAFVIILLIAFVLVEYMRKNKKFGFQAALLNAILSNPYIGFIVSIFLKNKIIVNKEHKYLEYCKLANKLKKKDF